jgi:hypothetical protein
MYSEWLLEGTMFYTIRTIKKPSVKSVYQWLKTMVMDLSRSSQRI